MDTPPPTKRPRIIQAPDGFTVSPLLSKVHVPRFSPAFQDKPASVQKPGKVITRPQFNLPADSKSKSLSVPKPAFKAAQGSKRAPKTISLTKPASKGNLKQLEVPTAQLLVNSESQGNTSTTSLYPLPPPPTRLPETPSKSRQVLTALGPPPVLPKPVVTPAKSMRTISTTNIALTNDLSTESGKTELASIFLHDQHPEILAHAEDDEVGNLNLGISPQKMGRSSNRKGKEPKFVRNGLAARASMLFSQTHTALALWGKEIENVLSSSGSTSRRLTPDLRFRIVKIIDVPVGSGSRRSGTSTTSPGLAVCRVLSAASRHKYTSHSLPSKKGEKNLLVVLSFPTTAPPRANTLHARNPEDFSEGREVYVWEPWQEVSISSSSPAVGASSTTEAELFNITAAPFPFLPSSSPLSPSPTQLKKEDISDLPLADTALLCSRFLIMH